MTTLTPWDRLVAEANSIGYTVELVEYCESPDSPGFLGAGLGVTIYGKKVIRIREALREQDRRFVLNHELDHARNDHREREFHAKLDADFHATEPERHHYIAEYLYPRERT